MKTDRKSLLRDAVEHVWPNFSIQSELKKKKPKLIVTGKGSWVFDIDGKKYIDGFSAILTSGCGHGRKEIVAAVKSQMEKLEFYPNVIDYYTIPVVKLAKKIASITPGNLNRIYFANDGSEAVETALKIARQYWWEKGYRRRYKIISRHWAYHGSTLGALSVNGLSALREPFEPLLPGTIHVTPPYCYHCELGLTYPPCKLACLKQMEEKIVWEKPDTIAAVIAEPVMGAATGFAVPPNDYLPGLRRLCDRHRILLIIDEVLTGFGRTGKFFAIEHWGIVPDILTMSKGMTGGFLPMSAVAVKEEIADFFLGEKSDFQFRHGNTYGGHPTCAASALANIEILEKENLVKRTSEMGKYLRERFEILKKYEIVGDIRGIGMLFGIELVKDKKRKLPFNPKLSLGTWIRNMAYERGLIIRNDGDILVVAPPFVLTKNEANMLVDIIDPLIKLAEKRYWKEKNF